MRPLTLEPLEDRLLLSSLGSGVFYTTPRIEDNNDPGIVKPGTVEKFGSGPVFSANGDPSDPSGGNGDPIGLAFDSAGNLYFGLEGYFGPEGPGAPGFQVSLMELTHTGQLANLGVVVDTSGGVRSTAPSTLLLTRPVKSSTRPPGSKTTTTPGL